MNKIFADALLNAEQPNPDSLLEPDVGRFDIYRNNVTNSLTDALSTTYPVCKKIVGDDFFRFCAIAYLRQHPPRSSSLVAFGDQLPHFISTFEPATSVRYLPDVAMMEWLLSQAHHAKDDTPMSAEQISMILSQPNLAERQVQLHSSVTLFQSDYAVASIWQYNMLQEQSAPDLNQPEQILICRNDSVPYSTAQIHPITQGQHAAIQAMQTGSTLLEAVALTEDPTHLLTLLIQTGSLTGLPHTET